MKEEEDRPGTYPPPPSEQPRGSYYPPPPLDSRPLPPADDRNGYNPQEAPRQGQYPSDPRASGHYPNDPRPPPSQYPPPSSWHHPPAHYPPPHAQYPDPPHPAYHYHPGPPADMSQPPQPRHPDPYRLPPPYPYPGYGPPHPYPQPPPPAPRQRTAIACKYCRKRKIRCSGYESSQDGRCNNCVRFNQSCLFHPVSSQAAFVPAQAVYPNMQNPRGESTAANQRGDYRTQGMYAREGESPPMLYGAHGIPLAPAAASQDHHPNYPPPSSYPPQSYAPPPHSQAPPATYEYRHQAPPPHPADENHSRKRGPPDDDPHNESTPSSQSPHPTTRARFSHEPRNSTTNGYDYPDPTNIAPTSPSTSATSYQSGYPYPGTASQAARRPSPGSAHSYDSPRTLPIRDDGKSPPPVQSGSAPGSANGRVAGMSVQAILGDPRTSEVDSSGQRRRKDDTEMLSKLDGKK